MSNKKNTIKTKIISWGKSILSAMIIASLFRWLLLENYTVPTSSMEKTLLSGDYIVVSKLHYGTRLPQTLLQIPLTHQTIWGTNIPSYLDWIKLPYFRLPGISKIKRNDKVVFNNINEPEAKYMPYDLTRYYIKRCVAIPGDTITIENTNLLINGVQQETIKKLQYHYLVKTTKELQRHFFESHNITEYIRINPNIYLIYTTSTVADKLKNNSKVIKEINIFTKGNKNHNIEIFPQKKNYTWNEDTFGPLLIPAKGMKIKINQDTIALYGDAIKKYEGHKNVTIQDNILYINNNIIDEYTFRKNYYFMLGDNRHNSIDSRYWGILPEDRIVGKAILVLFSIDKNKKFPFNIRFNRLLKSTNSLDFS